MRTQAQQLDLGATLLTYAWTATTDVENVYWLHEDANHQDRLSNYAHIGTGKGQQQAGGPGYRFRVSTQANHHKRQYPEKIALSP